MTIEPEELILVCYSDIAGQVRGKGFPARDLKQRLRLGIGWTPTNIMINCFNRIPATPFGPVGDLYLRPAPEGEVRLDFGDGRPAEHFFLGDVLTLGEEPWACCPRSFARRALDTLRTETGLSLYTAFEHEFHLFGADARSGDSYGLGSLRGVEPFIGDFLGALRANGLEPDTFLPEFGSRQYEVTVCPALGIEAADRAVKLREICRASARRHGLRASFSPVIEAGAIGNGVHIHFSLFDADGRPVSHDPAAPGGLSALAGSFAAGVLRHVRALCAVTAPSAISYQRLQPHSWSAYWGYLGLRDREALLRICPTPEASDIDAAPRFNLEFRAADAAASPYLQLGMLVFAGLQGLREGLPPPPVIESDPETFGPDGRRERRIVDLPRTLAEALDALAADETARGWLGPMLADAYLMHKRGEAETVEGMAADDLYRLYAEAY